MKSTKESIELKFISEIKKKANTIKAGGRERSVEDFFVSFFDGIPGFKASRADTPRLKYHKTLYTDGIVSFIISGNLSEKKIQELLDKSISEINSY